MSRKMSFLSYDPRSRSPAPPATYIHPEPSPPFDPSIGPDFFHPLPPASTAITIPNMLQYLVWLRKRHQGQFTAGEKLFSVLEEMNDKLKGAKEALFRLIMGDEMKYRTMDVPVIRSDGKPCERAEWKARMTQRADIAQDSNLKSRAQYTALGIRVQDFIDELEGFATDGWLKYINAEFAEWEGLVRGCGLEPMSLRRAPKPSTSASKSESPPLLPHERASPPHFRASSSSPSPQDPRVEALAAGLQTLKTELKEKEVQIATLQHALRVLRDENEDLEERLEVHRYAEAERIQDSNSVVNLKIFNNEGRKWSTPAWEDLKDLEEGENLEENERAGRRVRWLVHDPGRVEVEAEGGDRTAEEDARAVRACSDADSEEWDEGKLPIRFDAEEALERLAEEWDEENPTTTLEALQEDLIRWRELTKKRKMLEREHSLAVDTRDTSSGESDEEKYGIPRPARIPRSGYPNPFDTRSMVVETGSLASPYLTSFQDADRPQQGLVGFSSTTAETRSPYNCDSSRTCELADGNDSYTFSTYSSSPIDEHAKLEDLPKASEIEDRWLDEAQDLVEDMPHYSHDPSGTHASQASANNYSSGPAFIHIPLPANFTFSPSGNPTSLVTFPSRASAVHFPDGGTRNQLLGYLRAWFKSHGRELNTEELNIMQVRTRVMEFELKKAIARTLKTKSMRGEDGAVQIWETEGEGNTYIVSGTDVYFHLVKDESGDFEDETDDEEGDNGKNHNNKYVPEVEYPPSYRRSQLRGGAGEPSGPQTPCHYHFCSPDSFDEYSESGYTTPSEIYEGIGYAKLFFPHSNTPTTLEGMKTQYHATFQPSQANNLSWMAEARTRQFRVSELEHRAKVLQRKYDAARVEIERLEKTERETWNWYCDSVKNYMEAIDGEYQMRLRLEKKDHPYVAYRTAVKEMRDMAMRVAGQTIASEKETAREERPNMRGGAGERVRAESPVWKTQFPKTSRGPVAFDKAYTEPGINSSGTSRRGYAEPTTSRINGITPTTRLPTEPRTDCLTPTGFLFDVDSSMITFSNPRVYFQFPRGTTLSQIQQTLENRRANGMEDNVVLVRIREILELRQLKGGPDPKMHPGERVYIGIPDDLRDFLDAHPGYTIERTLNICRRFRHVRIVKPLSRGAAQGRSSVAGRKSVNVGHEFTGRGKSRVADEASISAEDEFTSPGAAINDLNDTLNSDEESKYSTPPRSPNCLSHQNLQPQHQLSRALDPVRCQVYPHPTDHFHGALVCCGTAAESLIVRMTDAQYQRLDTWTRHPSTDWRVHNLVGVYLTNNGKRCLFCNEPIDILTFDTKCGSEGSNGEATAVGSDSSGRVGSVDQLGKSFSGATLVDAGPAPKRSSPKMSLRGGAQLNESWAGSKIMHISHRGVSDFEYDGSRSPMSPLDTPPHVPLRSRAPDCIGVGGDHHSGILRTVDLKVEHEHESLALESGDESSGTLSCPDGFESHDDYFASDTSNTSKEEFHGPDDLAVDDEFYALAPGETPDGDFFPSPSTRATNFHPKSITSAPKRNLTEARWMDHHWIPWSNISWKESHISKVKVVNEKKQKQREQWVPLTFAGRSKPTDFSRYEQKTEAEEHDGMLGDKLFGCRQEDAKGEKKEFGNGNGNGLWIR